MKPIATGRINVTKILKEHLFKGNSGTYLNYAVFQNKDGADQYGNTSFVVQGISQEARERGEKGPIIGNEKRMGGADNKPNAPAPKAAAPKPAKDDDEDGVPF